jgi:imidazolonepropionase-like amidohydrolase
VFLTEAQAAGMAEAGCWLVPTLAVMEDVFGLARAGKLPPESQAKALELEPKAGQAIAIARQAGVRIALGTDSFTRAAHGRNLREIALMHRAGLTAPEALLAATTGGAELLGVADRYGRIAPGYVFDAVLLDEDPSDLGVRRMIPGTAEGVSFLRDEQRCEPKSCESQEREHS